MSQRDDDFEQPDAPEHPAPGMKALVGSVLCAAFGVQSSRNRERDFKHGKARTFIIAGIIFATLFVVTVFSVVNVVLKQAGH
jgi:hypothetical protein